MRKIRNFKCNGCGVVFEDYVKDDTKEVTCGCGKKADRIMSTPRYMGNSTGKSPARHR